MNECAISIQANQGDCSGSAEEGPTCAAAGAGGGSGPQTGFVWPIPAGTVAQASGLWEAGYNRAAFSPAGGLCR